VFVSELEKEFQTRLGNLLSPCTLSFWFRRRRHWFWV